MAEQTAEFEWRSEGEDAEIVLYAPSGSGIEGIMDRVRPVTRLPGVESPVYAAAAGRELGWAAASSSHIAPDLFDAPSRGLLLVSNGPLAAANVPPGDLPAMVYRALSEVRLPGLDTAGVRRIVGAGATAAAEDGLIEEDDLPFFGSGIGDPDTLPRRAIQAGPREWDSPATVRLFEVGEALDAGRAEELGFERGSLAFVVRAGAGDLGRIAVAAHRERILSRVRSGEFDVEPGLPAAPLETEEAVDLVAAVRAAARFADCRAALTACALRRALGETLGELGSRAGWGAGAVGERGGLWVHRKNLASAGSGDVLVSGESVVAGTGKMLESAPVFGAPEVDGEWPWEGAELLERLVGLKPLGDVV